MRAIKIMFTKIKHGLQGLLTVAVAQCIEPCFSAVTCSGDSGITIVEGQQTTANHTPGNASTTGADCAQIEVAKDASITTADTIVTFTANANYCNSPLLATAAPYIFINRGAVTTSADFAVVNQSSCPGTLLNAATGRMGVSRAGFWYNSGASQDFVLRNDGLIALLPGADYAVRTDNSLGIADFVNTGTVCAATSLDGGCSSAQAATLTADMIQVANGAVTNTGTLYGPTQQHAVVSLTANDAENTFYNTGAVRGSSLLKMQGGTAINASSGVLGQHQSDDGVPVTTQSVLQQTGNQTWTFVNFGSVFNDSSSTSISCPSQTADNGASIILQHNSITEGVVNCPFVTVYLADNAVYNTVSNSTVQNLVSISQSLPALTDTGIRSSDYGLPAVALTIPAGQTGIQVDNGNAVVVDTPYTYLDTSGVITSYNATAINAQYSEASTLINRNRLQSPSKAVDLMYADKPTLQNAGGTINANTLTVYLPGSANTTLINGPSADGVVGTISADTNAVEGSYTDALVVKNLEGGEITASTFALDMGFASNPRVSNTGAIKALQTDAINTIGSSGALISNGPNGSVTATNYAVRLAQAGAPLTAGILENQGLISTVGNDAISAPSSKSLSIHNSGQVTAGGITALDCTNCVGWEIINQGSTTAKNKTINLSSAISGLIINEVGAEIGADEDSAVLASGVSRLIMENMGTIQASTGNSLDISGSGVGFTPGTTATNLKLINGGSVVAQEGAAVNMAGANYPFLASSGSIQAGANTIFADLSNHSSIWLTGYTSASDAVALSAAGSTGLDVFLAGSIQAGRSAVIDLSSADQPSWLQTGTGTVSTMQSAGLIADSATGINVVNAGTWSTATTAIDLSGAAESTLVSNGAVASTTGAAIKTPTQAVLSGSVTGGTEALQTNGSSTVLVGAALAASAESGVAVNSLGQDMVAIAPYSSLSQPIRCQTNTCQVLTASTGSYTAPEAGLFIADSAVSQATSSAKTYTNYMSHSNTSGSHHPLITLGVVNDNNVSLPSVSTEIGLDWPNGQENPFVRTSGATYGGNINRWPSIDGYGEANQHAIVTIAGSVYSFYSETVYLPGTEHSLITIGKPNADNKTILQSDQVEVLSLDTNASVVTLQNAELLTMGTNFAWPPTDDPGMTTTITSGVKAQLRNSLLRLDNAEVNHLFSGINKNNGGKFDGEWPVVNMEWGGDRTQYDRE